MRRSSSASRSTNSVHRYRVSSNRSSNEDRGTLMPHDVLTTQRAFPADANFEVSGAVITFRDAAGVSWLRKPDGELTEWPG